MGLYDIMQCVREIASRKWRWVDLRKLGEKHMMTVVARFRKLLVSTGWAISLLLQPITIALSTDVLMLTSITAVKGYWFKRMIYVIHLTNPLFVTQLTNLKFVLLT